MGGAFSCPQRDDSLEPQLFGDQIHVNGDQYSQHQMQAMFLQGERPDMGFLSRKVAPPPEMQETYTIRNDVNLKKATLSLVQHSEDSNKYYVKFEFDAAKPCQIQVFYGATEVTDSETQLSSYTTTKGIKSKKMSFEKGLGQSFYPNEIKDLEWVNLSIFDTELLYYKEGTCIYPLVIVLEAIDDKETNQAQSQTSYATLEGNSETGYGIRLLKQKIHYNGRNYELQEIYGIEKGSASAASATTTDQEEKKGYDDEVEIDDDTECVICMSEPRDTTVLPCRHMCLCRECAETLRNQSSNCPICRTQVQSLLQIKINPKQSIDSKSKDEVV